MNVALRVRARQLIERDIASQKRSHLRLIQTSIHQQVLLTKKAPIIVDYLKYVSKNYHHIGEYFTDEKKTERLFFPCPKKILKILQNDEVTHAFNRHLNEWTYGTLEHTYNSVKGICHYFFAPIEASKEWQTYWSMQCTNIDNAGEAIKIYNRILGAFCFKILSGLYEDIIMVPPELLEKQTLFSHILHKPKLSDFSDFCHQKFKEKCREYFSSINLSSSDIVHRKRSSLNLADILKHQIHNNLYYKVLPGSDKLLNIYMKEFYDIEHYIQIERANLLKTINIDVHAPTPKTSFKRTVKPECVPNLKLAEIIDPSLKKPSTYPKISLSTSVRPKTSPRRKNGVHSADEAYIKFENEKRSLVRRPRSKGLRKTDFGDLSEASSSHSSATPCQIADETEKRAVCSYAVVVNRDSSPRPIFNTNTATFFYVSPESMHENNSEQDTIEPDIELDIEPDIEPDSLKTITNDKAQAGLLNLSTGT